jgi:hypothetical protein
MKTEMVRLPYESNPQIVPHANYATAPNRDVAKVDTPYQIGQVEHIIAMKSIAPRRKFGQATLTVTPPDSTVETDQNTEEPAMNTSAKMQASRIMEDVEALRSTDTTVFLAVAERVSAMAKEVSSQQLGDKHPLAAILAKKPSPDSIGRLERGMMEVREVIENPEI